MRWTPQSTSARKRSSQQAFLETIQELADDGGGPLMKNREPSPKRAMRDLGRCVQLAVSFFLHHLSRHCSAYLFVSLPRLEVRPQRFSMELTSYNREHADPNGCGSDIDSFIVSDGDEVCRYPVLECETTVTSFLLYRARVILLPRFMERLPPYVQQQSADSASQSSDNEEGTESASSATSRYISNTVGEVYLTIIAYVCVAAVLFANIR
jgi:hypothetical protein